MIFVVKSLKIFLCIVLLFIVFFVCLDIFHGDSSAEGFFTIARGSNVLQIAGNLQSQGYIGSRLIFILDTLNSGNFRKMKAGRYQIKKGYTNQELIEKFTKFQSLPINILIAPGKTTNNIAQILEQERLVRREEFLDLILNNSKSNSVDFYTSLSQEYSFLFDKPKDVGLEGYLFPDNYLVDSGATYENIIRQILDNFDKKLTQNLRDEIKNQKRTIFDILTMASILEKEVKTYDDKQTVAGILWKRVDNNLPLQVDSTLLYFQTSPHPSLLEKDVDSLYNTYKYAGLPKSPICNPDLESIKAAIYPQKTDYWFYLSAPDGETIYAKTLGQQLINKAKYLSK